LTVIIWPYLKKTKTNWMEFSALTKFIRKTASKLSFKPKSPRFPGAISNSSSFPLLSSNFYVSSPFPHTTLRRLNLCFNKNLVNLPYE